MKIVEILTTYDKILIVLVILLALIMLLIPFYYLNNDDEAELILKVQLEDELIKTVSVAESYDEKIIFEVEGPIGTHKIEVFQGKVRVLEAPKNDPLKICEQTGWIKREGPVIICVPNKLSLWLESSDSDIDGMSW